MTNGHSASRLPNDPLGPPAIGRDGVIIGGEILIGGLQLFINVLNLPDQSRTFSILVLVVVSFGLIWRYKAYNYLMLSFLVAALGGCLILGPPVLRLVKEWQIVPRETINGYHIIVHVFRDDNQTGKEEGKDPVMPNIVVKLRHEYGVETAITGRDGNAEFSVIRPGEVSIGVCSDAQAHICHSFHSHYVVAGGESQSGQKIVKIGLDSSDASCNGTAR